MQTAASSRRYDDLLRCRVPSALTAAIATAAARRYQTPAEYVRQALLARLETEGVRLAPLDRTEGSA
jgi:hypothetical protein